MIRFLEGLSMTAWPALSTAYHDGWVARFSHGYTRRANSVHPMYGGATDLARKVEWCEAAYRRHGLKPTFKLTAASEPGGLDAFLADRGYRREAATHVMTLALPAGIAADPATVHPVHPDWIETYASLQDVPARHRPTLDRILQAIPVPTGCAIGVTDGGAPASCGLAVLHGEWVGLFDIVTHPAHRRRGLAKETVSKLLAWSRAQGATHAYLQVMRDNAPALTLYRNLGFAPFYEYWYRVLD